MIAATSNPMAPKPFRAQLAESSGSDSEGIGAWEHVWRRMTLRMMLQSAHQALTRHWSRMTFLSRVLTRLWSRMTFLTRVALDHDAYQGAHQGAHQVLTTAHPDAIAEGLTSRAPRRPRRDDLTGVGPPVPATARPYPTSRALCTHLSPTGETLLRATGGRRGTTTLHLWTCKACGSRWERVPGPMAAQSSRDRLVPMGLTGVGPPVPPTATQYPTSRH